MDAADFKNPGQVIDWLKEKPNDWKNFVYSRWALRALPAMARTTDHWLEFYSVSIFRANIFSWASVEYLGLNSKSTAEGTFAALQEANRRAYDDNLAWDSLVYAMGATLATSGERATHLFYWEDDPNLRKNLMPWSVLEIPESVGWDCKWLNEHKHVESFVREMFTRELWPDQTKQIWAEAWFLLWNKLIKFDPNYSVWIDWYERRVRGERAAFDIPGDKSRFEDKKILRRLAEASDEDFWGKGHEYVNATLKGWLDEARERAAANLPAKVVEASGTVSAGAFSTASVERVTPIETPPQDTSAIAYGVNEQGKLDRLPNSDQVHLRDVPDQRRAYADLREAAAELLGEGQRLGHRLNRALDRFLYSLPDGFEDAEAYLVWRDANALRRLHRAHREAVKSPEPDEARLEPVVAEGLGGLLDLYNNFAFADDGLRAKDEARVAPQERASAEAEAKAAMPLVEAILANPQIATPEALDDILADEENAELSADDPYADQVLDQANRTKRNWIAGLISDTWAAFKNANPLLQGLVVNAAYDGAKLITTVIGGIEYAPLLEFIATNPGLLQHYIVVAFPTFEHLSEMIDRIRLLWIRLKGKV